MPGAVGLFAVDTASHVLHVHARIFRHTDAHDFAYIRPLSSSGRPTREANNQQRMRMKMRACALLRHAVACEHKMAHVHKLRDTQACVPYRVARFNAFLCVLSEGVVVVVGWCRRRCVECGRFCCRHSCIHTHSEQYLYACVCCHVRAGFMRTCGGARCCTLAENTLQHDGDMQLNPAYKRAVSVWVMRCCKYTWPVSSDLCSLLNVYMCLCLCSRG